MKANSQSSGRESPDLAMEVYRPLVGGTNMDNENDSGKSRIKSSAVDLYSNISIPPKLILLRNNTDLKTTPANWLSLKPKELLGGHILRTSDPRSAAFTSFDMASSFLNCIGEVDVVSDAENIKKLLKIPYSKSQVSMMVHRVGNTLLLDDFDIHTHLLRAAENEWGWLKKFYMEHVFASLHSKGGNGDPKTSSAQYNGSRKSTRHSRDYLQQQNLISKFLYHSLAVSDSANSETLQVRQDLNNESHDQRVQPVNSDPPIVEDRFRHGNPSSSLPQPFSKNIIWTFEDLRMLIGTDLPIFGGGTHPCLSLRLRDMSKPINVLTGLDYWLDNLMCNVPEVVMCYHLDGLVQKYELIKTDDLPRLPNSQFKPAIIKDVAQNILSFLKSKATKAGHTYWLFKGKDEDIVKLYDLSSLCSELNEENQNPFTTPVAMLLFKVARNLKMSSDWKRHQGTVLALLKNCLAILDMAKYPQVATAALYYLSDVYLPALLKTPEETTDGPSEENWDFEWEDESDMEDQFAASVDVKALSTPQQALQAGESRLNGKNARPTVGESMEQRCLLCLQHAVQALDCIVNDTKPASSPVQDEPTLASPLKPIPMPYEKLDKTATQVQSQLKESNKGTLISKEPMPVLTEWKQQYWRLLVEKCIQAYVALADETRKKIEPPISNATLIGRCFAHLNMAARLWNRLDLHGPFRSCALAMAGDLYFALVQNWSSELIATSYPAELEPTDRQLLNLLDVGSPLRSDDQEATVFPQPCNLLEALQLSLDNYRTALACFVSPECGSEEDGIGLAKRLGNVCNEMGVYFMSKATNVVEEGGDDWNRSFVQLFQSSKQHLEEGVNVFRQIGDSANIALLSCNLAKLHRIQARALAPTEKKEASLAEWKCYSRALQCYRQALDVLERRDKLASIWDAVVWDYTTVLFTLASLLQDFAPLSVKSREEVESEIIKLLETCITFSLGETSPSRLPLLQYRAATCHYRLASLHHDTYRNGEGESIINGRNVRTVAEMHYSSASELFSQLEHWDEMIRLQLEKAGIYEFQLKRLTGTGSKIRALQSVLNCYLATAPALSAVNQSDDSGGVVEPKTSECLALMGPKMQSTLLQLTKLAKNAKNTTASSQAEVYRAMYSASLRYNGKERDWLRQLSSVVHQLIVMQKNGKQKDLNTQCLLTSPSGMR